MIDKTYGTIEDLALAVDRSYRKCDDELGLVEVIGKHTEISKLLMTLCSYGYCPRMVHLEDVEYAGYDDEFVLSLFEKYVSVEPMNRQGNYLTTGGSETYILDNCNLKVIHHCDSDVLYLVNLKAY